MLMHGRADEIASAFTYTTITHLLAYTLDDYSGRAGRFVKSAHFL